jgi:hypothetical protein
MNIEYLKKYLFKLSIMELIAFVFAILIWLFSNTSFYDCLFISGLIFIGLGTLFLFFSGRNAVNDDFQRRKLGMFSVGTTMTDDESKQRTSSDIAVSYFQGSLFLWTGLIAVGLTFTLDYLRHR